MGEKKKYHDYNIDQIVLAKPNTRRYRLTGFEEENGDLVVIKVDEVLGLCGGGASKVPADDAVPCGAIFFVELALDVGGDVLFYVVFLQGLGRALDGLVVHLLGHVHVTNEDLGLGRHGWLLGDAKKGAMAYCVGVGGECGGMLTSASRELFCGRIKKQATKGHQKALLWLAWASQWGASATLSRDMSSQKPLSHDRSALLHYTARRHPTHHPHTHPTSSPHSSHIIPTLIPH
ncbi:hypothetical protein BC936DRAFT_141820 [Jimgerdemannia flammicorona]|uniref:Uncharacterized protein n=1 Tax=Jimgerdemannia flammicorona TaxID=994334 RepID=A0A433DFS0_9FUNG|nr:hypothetical protein BC936DRAFT_141820 [Jimgerdemannia flammicorona]